jgi:P-type E1-E2 ATPase
MENLKVLARATPLDKEILIRGLKFRNKIVAVTGNGITDVKCLQIANVGLAMGSGCSVAKEAADIILTNDDFEANIQAVMWGRNIFLNI